MAKCDEGYRCEVCGRDVEAVTESDLYLRFVLGEVPLEMLHRLPERHIRCNPALAQYVVHPDFAPVACEGPFAKSEMDAAFVAAEERRQDARQRPVRVGAGRLTGLRAARDGHHGAARDVGEVVAEGTPAEIRTNPAVVEAYLGSAEPDAAAQPVTARRVGA